MLVSFKYDPWGRRIEKSSSAGTSIYAYDGYNLIEETNAAGAAVARYSQGENVDEPLVGLRSGTTSYYEADALGSITSLSNAAGALTQTYTFDSFGNLVATSGSIVNNFRYTGRELDSETNLYYYRSRYYDPTAGRFMREDPRKEVVGGMNFYAYVRNNAVNFSDPNGRDPCGWLCNLWKWLKIGKQTYDPISSAVDWSMCGVYYVECLNQAAGIKKELAQALNSPDPVVSGTALATLAQQTGSNSMSQLNLNVCIRNENCEKALLCWTKGLTNPLPFPSW